MKQKLCSYFLSYCDIQVKQEQEKCGARLDFVLQELSLAVAIHLVALTLSIFCYIPYVSVYFQQQPPMSLCIL